MVQLTRAWPSGMSLALVSLSVLGCSESSSTPASQADKLALEVGEAGAPPDAGSGGQADAAPTCAPRDSTCDAIDDDCDGRFDEDFSTRCVFGGVAVVCLNGQITSQNCNDGDSCTTDSCTSGGCHHAAVSCRDDGNPCTAEQCTAGSCGSVPTPGVACDDGNACTVGDACDAAGSCSAGTLISVDDGNPCTADACDPSGGVTHLPATGASCDDGNACSQADACTATGTCQGLPRADISDGDPCTADSCDPASGAVTHTGVAIGASCSDGDACNGAETCQELPELSFTVDGRSSFLRVDNSDASQPPTLVSLTEVGLSAGQRVRFRTEGSFDAPVSQRAFVVFSSDSNLLPNTELNRVSGAIQSDAPPVVTGMTFFEHQTTDIPQDFAIDASDLEVQIPAGASFMFLGFLDSFYADNAGVLQVRVQSEALGCAAGTPPVLDDADVCTADACDPTAGVTHEPVTDGTSCTFESEPGACVEGACVACSAQPEACQLAPE